MALALKLRQIVLGAPIKTEHAHRERLTKIMAMAVFCSDAISSNAYATEEILSILMLTVALASAPVVAFAPELNKLLPIGIGITLLFIFVSISYVQTIHAYPSGGGSYSVSSGNLGSVMGRIAGGALLIDYVLTVAVSLSSGTGAIISAAQGTPYEGLANLPHTAVMLSLVFLVIITWGNLRGMRESSLIFSLPTYCFIVGLLALLAVAAWKFVILGMRPYPPHEVDVARLLSTTAEPLTLFMILRAFSGGCTALTGIEAISNGVPAFRKPESRNAATTLIIMAFIAMTMFVGLTWFAHHLRHLYPERPILALPMNVAGIPYQTVVSQIARATFGGQSWFYFFIQIATMAILVVAANTAFADFPRLSSVMARDGFLPRQLMNLGDKLVFQNGILTLSAVAGVLIVWSAGHTHKLLPLYAVGVFIAFTCSQAGMMVWQTRHRQPRWQFKAGLNAVGAAVTSIVALILFITKFHDGAWVVGLLLALLFLLFHTVSRHYADNRRKLEIRDDFSAPGKTSSRALVLVPRVHMGIL